MYIIHTHTFTSNHVIGLLIIIITIKFSIIISIRIIRSAHLSVTPSLDGRRRLQRDVRGAFPLVHMRVPSRPIVAQVRGDRVSCRLYRPRWNPLEPPRRAPSPSALLPLRGILNAAVAMCAEIAAEQRLTPSEHAVRSHGLPRPIAPRDGAKERLELALLHKRPPREGIDLRPHTLDLL